MELWLYGTSHKAVTSLISVMHLTVTCHGMAEKIVQCTGAIDLLLEVFANVPSSGENTERFLAG